MIDSKAKTIILDVDEVLLKWVEGFSDFLYKYYGVETKGVPETWEIAPWLGCSKETAQEFIRGFNEESDEFSELRPFLGSQDALNDLMRSGYKLYCVTAACNGTESKRSRVFNLLDVFGNVFEDVYFVPRGGSKKAVLRLFPKGSYYVEDYPYHLEEAAEIGLKSIMYIRPHNQGIVVKRAAMIDTWEEIARYIKRGEDEV